MGRTPASCSAVSTLVKQSEAQAFHGHEVVFVFSQTFEIVKWIAFNVQHVSCLLPQKTQYQRMAHTKFHEPINTAFALITIFSSLEKSDKSYQEDVHYCQALSDGKESPASHKLWRFPMRTSYQLKEQGQLLPDSSSRVLLTRMGYW